MPLSRKSGENFKALCWTIALLAPNLLLLGWLFRRTDPLSYLAVLYSFDPAWPAATRLPLLAVLLSCAYAWISRRAVSAGLGLGVFLFLGGSLVLFGGGVVFNLLALAPGIIVLAAASGAGLRILALPWLQVERQRLASALEQLVLAAALGLGVLAIAVFLLGSLGILSAWFWWPALLLLCAAGFVPLHALVKELWQAAGAPKAENDNDRRAMGNLAQVVGVFLALWVVFHAFLLWSPPLDYDVLEYHLGSPVQYLREGKVSFLPENMLAGFPQIGEMLYLLPMALMGGHKLRALPGAHVLLFGAWLLSIAGVYALAARLLGDGGSHTVGCVCEDCRGKDGRPPAAGGKAFAFFPLLGALFYALVPLGSQLAADFFVEHFQALFHIAALMAACVFLCERDAGVRSRWAWPALCGCLAGMACAVKYPAFMFTLLPLAFYLLLFCALSGSVFEGLRASALVVAPALAAASPWLARNFAAAGDPFYPLGLVWKQRLAGGGSKPALIDFFAQAIQPHTGAKKALEQLLPSFSPPNSFNQWTRNSEIGPHLLCFALSGFLAARRKAALLVTAVFATDVLLWFLFTHRLNRFFYPILGPLAVLTALGLARLWSLAPLRKIMLVIVAGVVLMLCPLTMLAVWHFSLPEFVAGLGAPEESARRQYCSLGNKNWFEGWQAINALPPAGAKVLMVGEAQTFYLDQTPVYATVFNRSLLQDALARSAGAREAARYLGALGITHLYINYSEWFRLDWSYALAAGSRGGWERAVFEKERWKTLRALLYGGQFAAYGRAWPAGVQHAYLPLADDDYAMLEELLLDYTVVEWQACNQYGAANCELRRIKQFP